jgi:hypothetical protein
MAIEFSNLGVRIFTGKVKGEFRHHFVNSKNLEQTKLEVEKLYNDEVERLKKLGIEV